MFRVFSQETAVWFNGLVASNYALSGALILLFYAVVAFLVSASFKDVLDSERGINLWKRWRQERAKDGTIRLSSAWDYFARAMLVPLSMMFTLMVFPLFVEQGECQDRMDAWCWQANGISGVHGYFDFVGFLLVRLQSHVLSVFIVLFALVGMAICALAIVALVDWLGKRLPVRW